MDYLNELLKKEYNNINIINDRYVTLRVNILKSNNNEIIDILDKNNIKYEKVSYYDNAFIIKNVHEDTIKELDIYKDGKIYLQSLSSMLPPLVLNVKSNSNFLDMCAAPGSKTSEVASLLNNNVLITACERNKKRYERLKYNLEHLGVKKCTVMNIDARDLNEYMRFDYILLDTPCTGTGTITNTNKDSFKLTKDILDKITNTQISLLNKGLSLLNKNGYLLYSTCSILKEEDEDIINKIIDNNYEIMPINIDSSIELLPSNIGIKIKPNNLYEGFYMCLIHKL